MTSHYPTPAPADLLSAYQARYAVPATYSSSSASSAPGWTSASSIAAPTATPFSSSAIMFGQEQSSYRSMAPGAAAAAGREGADEVGGLFQQHALVQPLHVARAVHIEEGSSRYAPEHSQWSQQMGKQDTMMTQQMGGFDAWGATSKQYASYAPLVAPVPAPAAVAAAPVQPAAKELSMPRLESLKLSRSVSLPIMPVYLESSCFSLAKAAMQPADMWTAVKSQLKRCGVVVAERQDRKFELDCQTEMGCSEFKVCCYGGHYRDSSREDGTSKPASAAHCYTVDFQRLRGCSVAFFQLFQLILAMLSHENGGESPLVLESRVAAAAAPAQDSEQLVPLEADAANAEDLGDMDLSLLPMPSLRASSHGAPSNPNMQIAEAAAPAQIMAPTESLFDSLHDLLSSADPAAQVSGLHALALCLDGSHPAREAQLMGEVAAMLRDGQTESVRQVAAMLISKAAQMHSTTTAATLIQACLPECVANLTAAAPLKKLSPLDASLAASRQKCLLRACLALSAALPAEFHAALMAGDGGAMRTARLKRHLLLLSASHEDQELRALAVQTVQTIQV